ENQLTRDKDAFLSELSLKKKNAELFNEEDEALRYDSKDYWRDDIDSAAVQAVDMQLVEDIFRRSYGDYSSMEIFICSDLDKETVKSYVEKYFASLEGNNKVKKGKYFPNLPAYKGETILDKTYKAPATQKSFVSFDWKIKVKPGKKTDGTYAILDHIMSARLLAKIREEMGGTYTISFRSKSYGDDLTMMESNISFETRPEMRDKLAAEAESILSEMAQNGPTAEEMSDAVKYLLKHEAEVREKTAHNIGMQLRQTMSYLRYGEDFDYDYEAVIDNVMPDDIKKLAAKIASGDKLVNLFTEE
nr:insulinase family protein [Bacteroidales bacterium]